MSEAKDIYGEYPHIGDKIVYFVSDYQIKHREATITGILQKKSWRGDPTGVRLRVEVKRDRHGTSYTQTVSLPKPVYINLTALRAKEIAQG